MAATDPMEIVRRQCLARGVTGIKRLGKTFKAMDDDGNWTLSFEEFSKGLSDYGVPLEEKQVRELFTRLDKDKTGSLDFDEFLRVLRPPLNEARKKITMAAFKKMDKTGDGVITAADIRGVYSAKKDDKWAEAETLETFLGTFESEGTKDGKVTLEEFLDYYSGISNSIDNDAYFELLMTNAWKL